MELCVESAAAAELSIVRFETFSLHVFDGNSFERWCCLRGEKLVSVNESTSWLFVFSDMIQQVISRAIGSFETFEWMEFFIRWLEVKLEGKATCKIGDFSELNSDQKSNFSFDEQTRAS